MVRKIRRALGFVGLSLILTVNTFSANLLLVNAEEDVQESTDIQEESLQTESLTAEESEQESNDPKQADAADAASKQAAAASDQADAADTAAGQTDEQTPDKTAGRSVNEKVKENANEGSSDQKESTPEAGTDKKSSTDTVKKGGEEVDSVEPANAAVGRLYFEEESVYYNADILDYDNQETLYLYDEEGILSVESSDEKVAVIDDWGWGYVYLKLKAPGTAQIDVTGLEGSKTSCTVTVEDPGLVVEEKEISASISEDDIGFSVTKGCGLTYTSSDPSVVQAYKDTEWDETGRYCRLEPQKPGKADILVKDFAGRTETVHVTITDANWSIEQDKINPPKTNLTKTKAGKKDFTAYWKKQAKQAGGYQIQYSTNSQFKKENKTVTVSKTGTTSKKVTGLKRKTTYYVRIRTFKKIGNTTFYSGWSAAKKVKTK